MWYKTKKSAVYGAKVYAEKENKNVIIINHSISLFQNLSIHHDKVVL